MENHHISTGKGRGVISEEAAADVVQLQAFVSLQPVGTSKGPVPQQDADVSMPSVRIRHLQRKLVVNDDDVDQRCQQGEEKDEEEASGPPIRDCRNKRKLVNVQSKRHQKSLRSHVQSTLGKIWPITSKLTARTVKSKN